MDNKKPCEFDRYMKHKLCRAFLMTVWFSLCITHAHSADTLTVSSPSGNIRVKVWLGKQLFHAVDHQARPILNASSIDIVPVNKAALSVNNSIKSWSVKKVANQIISPVPEKRKLIPDNYNQLNILFKQPYKVEFKVYDDGGAYRISTLFKDSIIIKNEVAEFNFVGSPYAYFPEITDRKGKICFIQVLKTRIIINV